MAHHWQWTEPHTHLSHGNSYKQDWFQFSPTSSCPRLEKCQPWPLTLHTHVSCFSFHVSGFKLRTSLCWLWSFNFHRRIVFPTSRGRCHTSQERRELQGRSGQLCTVTKVGSGKCCRWTERRSTAWPPGRTIHSDLSTRSPWISMGWGISGLHVLWNLLRPFRASGSLQCCLGVSFSKSQLKCHLLITYSPF